MNSREAISRALALNNVSIDPEALDRITAYADYLLEWNERINLISRASLENVASHHIVDSVLAARLLPAVSRITDLGTGGGLPGIIISILAPETEVILCDTKAKKINFLNNCVRDLNLPHTRVHDAAKSSPEKNSDILVCRAFATLDKILREEKNTPAGRKDLCLQGAHDNSARNSRHCPKIRYETTAYSSRHPANHTNEPGHHDLRQHDGAERHGKNHCRIKPKKAEWERPPHPSILHQPWHLLEKRSFCRHRRPGQLVQRTGHDHQRRPPRCTKS